MKDLAEVLKEIKRRVESGNPPHSEIDKVVSDMGGSLIELFTAYQNWPDFTGRIPYPIPAPDGGCPAQAFDQIDSEDFYNRSTKYGSSRMGFIDWAIAKYQAKPEGHKIKAEALEHFADMIVGAFDSGFLDSNQFTIGELYVAIRDHAKDNYGAEIPKLEEKYGEQLAKDLSVK